ncbi:hypothetical protein FA15DRAFT_673828 [Coprinopsis marcescibilis]|uniref:Uncharacterized protein n=1 Tax=Coprinopsis marcescibilis TaxID=230819 RepID=A0A5C3KJ60_COPMA|nr:hypothetical protein FA15DRAFT_673828 [Coprinopsis marcescibilis]
MKSTSAAGVWVCVGSVGCGGGLGPAVPESEGGLSLSWLLPLGLVVPVGRREKWISRQTLLGVGVKADVAVDDETVPLAAPGDAGVHGNSAIGGVPISLMAVMPSFRLASSGSTRGYSLRVPNAPNIQQHRTAHSSNCKCVATGHPCRLNTSSARRFCVLLSGPKYAGHSSEGLPASFGNSSRPTSSKQSC